MSPRNVLSALVLVLAAGGTIPVAAEPPAPTQPPAAPKPPPVEAVWLEISDLEAPEAAPVETAMKAVPGVRSLEWSVLGSEVYVVREVGKAPDASLAAAAAGAGATAKRIPVVGGALVFDTKLHCGNCAKKVVTALTKVSGVKKAVVTKDMTAVQVAFDRRATTVDKLAEAVTAAGYPAKVQP